VLSGHAVRIASQASGATIGSCEVGNGQARYAVALRRLRWIGSRATTWLMTKCALTPFTTPFTFIWERGRGSRGGLLGRIASFFWPRRVGAVGVGGKLIGWRRLFGNSIMIDRLRLERATRPHFGTRESDGQFTGPAVWTPRASGKRSGLCGESVYSIKPPLWGVSDLRRRLSSPANRF